MQIYIYNSKHRRNIIFFRFFEDDSRFEHKFQNFLLNYKKKKKKIDIFMTMVANGQRFIVYCFMQFQNKFKLQYTI